MKPLGLAAFTCRAKWIHPSLKWIHIGRFHFGKMKPLGLAAFISRRMAIWILFVSADDGCPSAFHFGKMKPHGGDGDGLGSPGGIP